MKLRLFARLFLFILVPTLLGIGVLSFVSSKMARTVLEKQIDEDMALLVHAQSSEISNVLMLMRGVTNTQSEVLRLKLYLDAIVANAPQAEIDKLKLGVEGSLHSTTSNFKRIRDAVVVSAQGQVLVATRAGVVGRDIRNEDYFKRTMKGESCIATVVGENNKALDVIVTAPITYDGKSMGIVYTIVDMPQLIASTVATIKVGTTGECYVYNPSGMMLMHGNAAFLGADHSATPWVQQAFKSTSGRLEYEFDGSTKLGFYGHVPGLDWIVIIAADKSDMLSGISELVRMTILLASGILVIVGGIIAYIAKDLANVMRGGAGFAKYVAEGNLVLTPTMRAMLTRDSNRGDEIGDLAGAMGVMVQNLVDTVNEARVKTNEAEVATAKAEQATKEADEARGVAENAKRDGMLAAAGQLEGVVEIITSASAQLTAQIERSERGSSAQASRLAETATAMDEMNSTVMEVARNAGLAAEVSSSTRINATEGAFVVAQTVNSIGEVQTQSLALKEDMLALGQQAEAISKVMSVISDIADQTNLLALNAAIEAARAGDAGRGFAVVADEVRKLAEKTMHSTVDVSTAVKNIQASASKNMQQVDIAVNTIAKANTLAAESGTALKAIVEQADSTADQVRLIATASEEQSAASEEITRSISEVNGIAVETSQGMLEAAQAVNELARQSQILNNLIEDMKRG